MDKKNIKTKVSRPKQSGVLLRRRLFKEIDAGLERSIVWISGPAGSGKTTLARSYLEARKLPSLWYHFTQSDTDIASFFYHMGMAAQKATPRYRKPLPLLTPEYMQGLPVFTKRFFLELYSRLKQPFVMVFDDYDALNEDSVIHAIINDALAIVPEGITILVLSRGGPPPTFARRLAEKRITTLGWEDLRFTYEECRALVPSDEMKNLPEEVLQHLHRHSYGWAAGIVLMLETLKTAGLNLSTDFYQPVSREIFDYFANEVLDRLDADTRDFLLMSCLLPTMTVRSAEALTHNPHTGRMLSLLSKDHFFTEKRAGKVAIYEYHPLFREFLLKRMKESLNDEGVLHLQKRAAAVLEQEGQIEDAVRYLIEARDWKNLIPILVNHAPALLSQGRSMTLLDSFEKIPAAIREADPWLLYWLGACKIMTDPAESRVYFEKAFLLFEENRDSRGALMAWSGIVDTFFLEFGDFKPLDKWIEWLDARIREGLTFPSREVEARVAAGMTGALLWRMPEHPDMKKWANRAMTLLKNLDVNAALRAYLDVTLYHVWMGDFQDCKIVLDEMKGMAELFPASPLTGIMVHTAEAIFYSSFTTRHADALQAVSSGLEAGKLSGVHIMDVHLSAHGVHGSLHAGDLDLARDYLSKMEKLSGSRNIIASSLFYYLSTWVDLLSDDTQQAVAFAKKSIDLIEMTGAPVPEACTRIGAAFAFYAAEDFLEAERQLEYVRNIAERTRSAYLRYLYRITRAYIDLDRKKEETGLQNLQRALLLGRKKQFNMLSFFRPAMGLLCRKAMETGTEVSYARQLIYALDLVPDTLPVEPEAWPWDIAIRTLGTFEIKQQGTIVQFQAKVPRKLLALLKALISCGPKGISEDQLADLLWPEASGDAAVQSMHTGLHRLRQLLGSDRSIQVREGRIKFDSQRCCIDAHAFEDLLSLAEEKLSMAGTGMAPKEDYREGIRALERALMVYKGKFLEDAAEPWAMSYRERLRNKYLKGVQRLAGYFVQEGLFEKAVTWYEKGLDVDDVAEPFYQGLITCHGSTGRYAEARAAYHRCKRILKAVLNVAPSSETDSLFNAYTG